MSKTKEVERMTPEEIANLANDIVTGQIYFPRSEEEVELSFGTMFMFMNPEDYSEEYLKSIGSPYEYYSEALERSVNGKPMFFSMKLIHKDDLPSLTEQVNTKLKALGLGAEDNVQS